MKIPNLSRGVGMGLLVGGMVGVFRWRRYAGIYMSTPENQAGVNHRLAGLVSSRDTRGGSWLQRAVQRAWMMQTLTLSLLVLRTHYPCKQMETKSVK